MFENERSVSRSHCSLRLIGSTGSSTSASNSKKKKADDDNNCIGEPKGDEEKEACENAEDGWAIVLDDLGRCVRVLK